VCSVVQAPGVPPDRPSAPSALQAHSAVSQVHPRQRLARSARWEGGARRREHPVQAPVTPAPLDVGATGQDSAIPCSAMPATRAPGAPLWGQPRRTHAFPAGPALGVRSRVPSPTRSARPAPPEDGRARRGLHPCRGASAAILAPTARILVQPVLVSVGSVQQAPGADRQVPPRTLHVRIARRAPRAAPLVLRARARVSAARRVRGATPRERAPRMLARPAAPGSISQRWARPPRRTASSASLAATTMGSELRAAPGAPKALGAPLVVRPRAMSVRTALGPTFKVRFMPTTALAVGDRMPAHQARPPA